MISDIYLSASKWNHPRILRDRVSKPTSSSMDSTASIIFMWIWLLSRKWTISSNPKTPFCYPKMDRLSKFCSLTISELTQSTSPTFSSLMCLKLISQRYYEPTKSMSSQNSILAKTLVRGLYPDLLAIFKIIGHSLAPRSSITYSAYPQQKWPNV